MQNSRLPDERRLAPSSPSPAEDTSVAMLRDIAELLFASRDVARMQFTRVAFNGASMVATIYVCVECRHEQFGGSGCHAPSCRAGRLVQVLCKLLNVDLCDFLSQSSTEGISSEERASSSPASGTAPSAHRSQHIVVAEIPWSPMPEGGAR